MKKVVLVLSLVTAAVLLIGWWTSARLVEVRFLVDGIPQSEGSLEILASEKGVSKAVFDIPKDGWLQLPSSFAGQVGLCRVRDIGASHEFLELGFRRGKTTVNFTADGIEFEHFYSFLSYESLERSTPLKPKEWRTRRSTTNPTALAPRSLTGGGCVVEVVKAH